MYSWMNFYSTLFLLFGLFVAAVSKLSLLYYNGNKLFDDQLNYKIKDAFAWWGFFSLTLGGMLIPILNEYFSHTSTPFPNSPIPISELSLIIYLGIGILLTANLLTEQKHPIQNKKVRYITLPSEDYFIFLYPFLILVIIVGRSSDLSGFKKYLNIIFQLSIFLFFSWIFLIELFELPVSLIAAVFITLFMHFLGFSIIRRHP